MPAIVAISVYVHDMEKAVAFYRDILGFKVKSAPVPFITELEHEGVALVLCLAEAPVKSGYPRQAGVVIGIAGGNIKERAKQLAAKGVTLVVAEPQEFPGGTFIAFNDPSGNVVELLEFA